MFPCRIYICLRHCLLCRNDPVLTKWNSEACALNDMEPVIIGMRQRLAGSKHLTQAKSYKADPTEAVRKQIVIHGSEEFTEKTCDSNGIPEQEK